MQEHKAKSSIIADSITNELKELGLKLKGENADHKLKEAISDIFSEAGIEPKEPTALKVIAKTIAGFLDRESSFSLSANITKLETVLKENFFYKKNPNIKIEKFFNIALPIREPLAEIERIWKNEKNIKDKQYAQIKAETVNSIINQIKALAPLIVNEKLKIILYRLLQDTKPKNENSVNNIAKEIIKILKVETPEDQNYYQNALQIALKNNFEPRTPNTIPKNCRFSIPAFRELITESHEIITAKYAKETAEQAKKNLEVKKILNKSKAAVLKSLNEKQAQDQIGIFFQKISHSQSKEFIQPQPKTPQVSNHNNPNLATASIQTKKSGIININKSKQQDEIDSINETNETHLARPVHSSTSSISSTQPYSQSGDSQSQADSGMKDNDPLGTPLPIVTSDNNPEDRFESKKPEDEQPIKHISNESDSIDEEILSDSDLSNKGQQNITSKNGFLTQENQSSAMNITKTLEQEKVEEACRRLANILEAPSNFKINVTTTNANGEWFIDINIEKALATNAFDIVGDISEYIRNQKERAIANLLRDSGAKSIADKSFRFSAANKALNDSINFIEENFTRILKAIDNHKKPIKKEIKKIRDKIDDLNTLNKTLENSLKNIHLEKFNITIGNNTTNNKKNKKNNAKISQMLTEIKQSKESLQEAAKKIGDINKEITQLSKNFKAQFPILETPIQGTFKTIIQEATRHLNESGVRFEQLDRAEKSLKLTRQRLTEAIQNNNAEQNASDTKSGDIRPSTDLSKDNPISRDLSNATSTPISPKEEATLSQKNTYEVRKLQDITLKNKASIAKNDLTAFLEEHATNIKFTITLEEPANSWLDKASEEAKEPQPLDTAGSQLAAEKDQFIYVRIDDPQSETLDGLAEDNRKLLVDKINCIRDILALNNTGDYQNSFKMDLGNIVAIKSYLEEAFTAFNKREYDSLTNGLKHARRLKEIFGVEGNSLHQISNPGDISSYRKNLDEIQAAVSAFLADKASKIATPKLDVLFQQYEQSLQAAEAKLDETEQQDSNQMQEELSIALGESRELEASNGEASSGQNLASFNKDNEEATDKKEKWDFSLRDEQQQSQEQSLQATQAKLDETKQQDSNQMQEESFIAQGKRRELEASNGEASSGQNLASFNKDNEEATDKKEKWDFSLRDEQQQSQEQSLQTTQAKLDETKQQDSNQMQEESFIAQGKRRELEASNGETSNGQNLAPFNKDNEEATDKKEKWDFSLRDEQQQSKKEQENKPNDITEKNSPEGIIQNSLKASTEDTITNNLEDKLEGEQEDSQEQDLKQQENSLSLSENRKAVIFSTPVLPVSSLINLRNTSVAHSLPQPETGQTIATVSLQIPKSDKPYKPEDRQFAGLALFLKFCALKPDFSSTLVLSGKWHIDTLKQVVDCCLATGRPFKFGTNVCVNTEKGIVLKNNNDWDVDVLNSPVLKNLMDIESNMIAHQLKEVDLTAAKLIEKTLENSITEAKNNIQKSFNNLMKTDTYKTQIEKGEGPFVKSEYLDEWKKEHNRFIQGRSVFVGASPSLFNQSGSVSSQTSHLETKTKEEQAKQQEAMEIESYMHRYQ